MIEFVKKYYTETTGKEWKDLYERRIENNLAKTYKKHVVENHFRDFKADKRKYFYCWEHRASHRKGARDQGTGIFPGEERLGITEQILRLKASGGDQRAAGKSDPGGSDPGGDGIAGSDPGDGKGTGAGVSADSEELFLA